MDKKSEKIALFRYGLVATLVVEILPHGELSRRAREIASRQYEIPYSKRSSVCVDTLLHWAARYRQGGFEALAPQPRLDRGVSRVITPQTAELIERLKRENPHRTGTTLLRELALSSGQNIPLSASTLYRFLNQHGLTARQLLAPDAFKKFVAEFSNDVWQSDMLHGPYVLRPGGGKMQAFLHAILDDASRIVPHGEFYPDQGLDSALDCFRQGVGCRGVPIRYYADNAKIYRSPQLARIAASLGVVVIHTPPYQPEGRGKIERFFRRVRDQFLANLTPKQTLSLEDLNTRFAAWIENSYHCTEHTALGTTPLLRWQRDIERIRLLPPGTDLRRLFFHRVDRLVRKDCTFLLKNHFYEAPAHLAGQTIEVRFDPLDLSQLDIYFQGQPQGFARPVDPVLNAQLPSSKPKESPEPEPTGINYVELLTKKQEE
jgi:putative transposase